MNLGRVLMVHSRTDGMRGRRRPITWRQALTWRMDRQKIEPVGALTAPELVRRLCGVQAQLASSAELAIGLRQAHPRPDEVRRAMHGGELIRTWAMRGTLHLLTPLHGADLLSLMAAGRSWEQPRWQRHFGMTAWHWDVLRNAVRGALDSEPLTREELLAAIVNRRGLKHLGPAVNSGWSTVLKPLAWQGELCSGPRRGGRVTFTRPEVASSQWRGLPDPEEAAPRAILSYLGAYGPATADDFATWLTGGWFGKSQVRQWFSSLTSARLAEIELDGRTMYIAAEHVDELADVQPASAVRLLPSFDQYVLARGAAANQIVPSQRREAVIRRGGWISPVVLVGGTVCGTWQLDGDSVQVSWFREAGRLPRAALKAETTRLASILERDVSTELSLV